MTSSTALRVIFMGSPAFAVPIFDALCDSYKVVAAVTQPDRPAGRGRSVTPPAVKLRAVERNVPVLQPTRIKTPDFRQALEDLHADVTVVAAFGRILPEAVLNVPSLGSFNVHASLLPAWRGAAPIQWSIISGDSETGVSIMRMDAGLDTGPIAVSRRTPIGPHETAGTLSDRLSTLGAGAIVEALERLCVGQLPLGEQDHGRATHAPPLSKADGRLDLARSAREVSCLTRGVDPWPGAQVSLGSAVVRLFGPTVLPLMGPPGKVLALDGQGLVVACGAGAVAFAELQLPGRKRLPASAVVAGRGIRMGDILT